MADEKFRLPGSSYPELVKIIKAYSHSGKSATLEDVSKLAVMNPTSISRSNVFLSAIGVIAGGQKKSITEQGQQLARALDYEMPNEIRRHWKMLVRQHEFFQKLLAAVRIRNGMDASTLTAHAAYTAGQPNDSKAKTGAAAVIDILQAADLLVEREGKLFVNLTHSPSASVHRGHVKRARFRPN
jgi:hypothetical protein